MKRRLFTFIPLALALILCFGTCASAFDIVADNSGNPFRAYDLTYRHYNDTHETGYQAFIASDYITYNYDDLPDPNEPEALDELDTGFVFPVDASYPFMTEKVSVSPLLDDPDSGIETVGCDYIPDGRDCYLDVAFEIGSDGKAGRILDIYSYAMNKTLCIFRADGDITGRLVDGNLLHVREIRDGMTSDTLYRPTAVGCEFLWGVTRIEGEGGKPDELSYLEKGFEEPDTLSVELYSEYVGELNGMEPVELHSYLYGNAPATPEPTADVDDGLPAWCRNCPYN